ETDGPLLFYGAIDAPSGIVTLTDSSNFPYLNIPVPEGRVTVHVWAENDRHPDWVWLQLDAFRPI
ncbi:MAG: hypothetical protein ABIS14_09170, partial [Sphingomonas sp.]